MGARRGVRAAAHGMRPACTKAQLESTPSPKLVLRFAYVDRMFDRFPRSRAASRQSRHRRHAHSGSAGRRRAVCWASCASAVATVLGGPRLRGGGGGGGSRPAPLGDASLLLRDQVPIVHRANVVLDEGGRDEGAEQAAGDLKGGRIARDGGLREPACDGRRGGHADPASRIEALRAKWGRSALRIAKGCSAGLALTSGYRCPHGNASIAGASRSSYHMEGRAVDISTRAIVGAAGIPYARMTPDQQVELEIVYLELLSLGGNIDEQPWNRYKNDRRFHFAK